MTSCTAVPTVLTLGAVLRGLRLVDLDLPVDAGQRQAVVEVADVACARRAWPRPSWRRPAARPDRARRAAPGSACRSAGRRAAPSPRPGCRECRRSWRGCASMISCAGGRVRQSANSNWMTPMVSSVISLDAARLLADAGVDGLEPGERRAPASRPRRRGGPSPRARGCRGHARSPGRSRARRSGKNSTPLPNLP